MTDWGQKSSVGGSYSDTGFVVMDAWKDDVQASSNPSEDLKRKYEELQGKFYGLAACHLTFSSIGEPDLVCQTAMVSACAKTGDFAFARKLFNKMPHKDPITWNVMILGYA